MLYLTNIEFTQILELRRTTGRPTRKTPSNRFVALSISSLHEKSQHYLIRNYNKARPVYTHKCSYSVEISSPVAPSRQHRFDQYVVRRVRIKFVVVSLRKPKSEDLVPVIQNCLS